MFSMRFLWLGHELMVKKQNGANHVELQLDDSGGSLRRSRSSTPLISMTQCSVMDSLLIVSTPPPPKRTFPSWCFPALLPNFNKVRVPAAASGCEIRKETDGFPPLEPSAVGHPSSCCPSSDSPSDEEHCSEPPAVAGRVKRRLREN